MSLMKHRLSRVPRPTRALYVRNVNILGYPSQRVKGELDSENVLALPDSGAELNMISYEYARRRGWLLNKMSGRNNLLQFANGSLARTEGQVHAIWQFLGSIGSQVKKDVIFDV